MECFEERGLQPHRLSFGQSANLGEISLCVCKSLSMCVPICRKVSPTSQLYYLGIEKARVFEYFLPSRLTSIYLDVRLGSVTTYIKLESVQVQSLI